MILFIFIYDNFLNFIEHSFEFNQTFTKIEIFCALENNLKFANFSKKQDHLIINILFFYFL